MTTIAVSNESEASFSRMTKDGRKLTYELRVLQQPQRARACGSGAKSSADRRPVDPPPVIELKVFEGDQKTDITFNHKANFFVYTTLEAARPIAQPRGQPLSQPPVLTGSPVSGAALLDRPSPAAYFIFPDLSVRHEGKYRLSFNLFEELKDPKDDDVIAVNNMGHSLLSSSPMAAQAHVHFRLEVRSKPFTVYSAKKFPGLAESTSLSRVVAEQGCRVRIRRDVRMRRRDTKSGKDSGDHDEISSYPSYSEPPSADLYRQPSMEQLQQQHQAPPPPPQPQQPMDHSYYNSTGYQAPQYAHHPQVPAYMPQPRPVSQQQYQPVQPSPVDQSPVQNPYQQTYNQYPAPHTHTRHPSISSSHDSSVQTPGSAYPQQPTQHQHAIPPQPYAHPFYHEQAHAAQGLAVDHPHQYPVQRPTDLRAATPNSTHLPPLKSIQPAIVKPEASVHESNTIPDVYDMSSTYSVNAPSVAAQVRAGAKRGYDRVFDAGRSTGYTNGGRQDTSGQDLAQISTDEGLYNIDELLNMKMLSYRRANGAMQTRRVTSPGEV